MTTIPKAPLERFRYLLEALTEVLQEIVQRAKDEGCKEAKPDLLRMATGIIQSLHDKDIMISFIANSYPYWDRIREGKRETFSKYLFEILKDLPEIESFKVVMEGRNSRGQSYVKVDDIDYMFDALRQMVKTSIRYMFLIKKTVGNINLELGINLESEIKKWNITI